MINNEIIHVWLERTALEPVSCEKLKEMHASSDASSIISTQYIQQSTTLIEKPKAKETRSAANETQCVVTAVNKIQSLRTLFPDHNEVTDEAGWFPCENDTV